MEITAGDFNEKLQSGKILFIYFEHQGRPLIWDAGRAQIEKDDERKV